MTKKKKSAKAGSAASKAKTRPKAKQTYQNVTCQKVDNGWLVETWDGNGNSKKFVAKTATEKNALMKKVMGIK